jgi:hypothetical protein
MSIPYAFLPVRPPLLYRESLAAATQHGYLIDSHGCLSWRTWLCCVS